MLCDKCKVNQATIKYQQNINGQKSSMNLCSQCAKELGMATFDMDMDLNGFLASMFNFARGGVEAPRVKCPSCGYTLDRFNKSGLLGCPDCYDTFHDAMETVIRNIQGSTTYLPGAKKSKKETEADEVSRLRAELYEAVKNEEYEKAAVLRDRLKGLEEKKEENKNE